jgi:hypothetical protein
MVLKNILMHISRRFSDIKTPAVMEMLAVIGIEVIPVPTNFHRILPGFWVAGMP